MVSRLALKYYKVASQPFHEEPAPQRRAPGGRSRGITPIASTSLPIRPHIHHGYLATCLLAIQGRAPKQRASRNGATSGYVQHVLQSIGLTQDIHRTCLTRVSEHELHRTTTGTTVLDKDHIVLLPKPSRSPADPLNWAAARRWAILFTMCFYALAADFAAGAVAPAIPIMAYQFVPHTPTSKLTQLVAVSWRACVTYRLDEPELTFDAWQIAFNAVPGHFQHFLGAAWQYLRPQTDSDRFDDFPCSDVRVVRPC